MTRAHAPEVAITDTGRARLATALHRRRSAAACESSRPLRALERVDTHRQSVGRGPATPPRAGGTGSTLDLRRRAHVRSALRYSRPPLHASASFPSRAIRARGRPTAAGGSSTDRPGSGPPLGGPLETPSTPGCLASPIYRSRNLLFRLTLAVPCGAHPTAALESQEWSPTHSRVRSCGHSRNFFPMNAHFPSGDSTLHPRHGTGRDGRHHVRRRNRAARDGRDAPLGTRTPTSAARWPLWARRPPGPRALHARTRRTSRDPTRSNTSTSTCPRAAPPARARRGAAPASPAPVSVPRARGGRDRSRRAAARARSPTPRPPTATSRSCAAPR